MGHAEPKPWTLDEFLSWERAQSERYEYIDGVVRMMTGGTKRHSVILGNLYAALRHRLRGSGCRPYVDTPKIIVHSQCLYPDVFVTCGDERMEEDYVVDAVLIAEVLSSSTQAYDRGAKWRLYQTIPALRHYLLVSQDGCAVDLFTREEDGWRPLRCVGLDQSLPLTAFDFDLPLAELYEDSSITAITTSEL